MSDTGEEVLDEWVSCAISGYDDFTTDAAQLHAAVVALCEGPDDTTLSAARASYHTARRTWLGLRTFAIGPEVDYPLRYGPKIDFRPPRYADLASLLESSEDLLPPAQTGAHLRGFPAIELVLFGPSSDDLSSDGRACEFVVARTADLHESALGLSLAWAKQDGNFAAEVLAESGTTTFATSFEAMSGLVNRMGYVVENLRDQDILAPLGTEADTVQVDLIVSRLSQRTNDDFLDTLAGVEKLVLGTRGGLSLDAYAKEQHVDMEDELRAAFEEARAKVAALPSPYADALSTDRTSVEEADAALLQLQLLLQVDLMGRLELPQIFNDADGD